MIIAVMPGLVPRVSGTVRALCRDLHGGTTTGTTTLSRSGRLRLEVEHYLWWLWLGNWLEKLGNWPSLHQVCVDQPGEGERAGDDPVGIMDQAQQQVMLHGVDPFRVQVIRNQLEASRINAVHFFKHRPCQTLVGQARA